MQYISSIIKSNSAMSIKLKSLFVACIIYAYVLDVAVGMPDIADTRFNPAQNTELDVNGATMREKRQLPCSTRGGCYRGSCWAGCIGALSGVNLGNLFNSKKIISICKIGIVLIFLLSQLLTVAPGFNNPEWCYTTRSYSQSYRYVSCSNDNECDLCWKCAGPCSV